MAFEDPEESQNRDDSEGPDERWWNSPFLRSRAGLYLVVWVIVALVMIFSSGPATLWLVGVIVGGGLVAFLIHSSHKDDDGGEL